MAQQPALNILAISYDLPPTLSPQAIQIGRLLSRSRHRIVAVSGPSRAEGPSTDCNRLREAVDRHVVPFSRHSGGLLKRIARRSLPLYGTTPDVYRGWIEPAGRFVTNLIASGAAKPDLIISFGDPMSDHLIGYHLKQRFRLPWLAHFSDPWSDNPFRRFQPLSSIVNRALERRVIEGADATAFTSDETVELVFGKYPNALRARSEVLPHTFDGDAYPKDEGEAPRAVLLRYIGNFYGHRTPEPLFRALAHLLKVAPTVLQGVAIEIVGGIPNRMLRSASFEALPPGLVTVRGTVSYTESLRLMCSSDILLTIDAPAPLSVFFPSKLVDYIGSGRRLVGLVPPGAAARVIGELGGRSVPPDAPVEAISQMLREEIIEARARKRSPLEGPRQLWRKYAIDNVAPMFDSLCSRVVENAGASRS